MSYVQDDDGPWVCPDCTTFCIFGTPLMTPCDRDGCRCERCERSRRALELDDRPVAADFLNTQEVDNKTPVRPA